MQQSDRPSLSEADVDRAVGLHRISRNIMRAMAEQSGEGIDRALEDALAEVGAYCGVGRAYVFRFRDDMAFVDNTHEWCAEGVTPEIDNLQGLPAEVARSWVDAFERDEFVFVPSVADIPDSDRELREILEPQGILSLLVVPLRAGGRLTGFVGFDYVHSLAELSWIDVDVLQTVADTVAAALFRHDAEERLLRAGRRDPLTGLPNDTDFRELVTALVADVRERPAPERRLVVAIIDIDRLAEVNIAHGIAAGDAVIREIGHRLAAAARPSDHIFRIGSDEFAVVVDGDHRVDTAGTVAQRFRAELREPVVHDGHQIRVSAGIGVFASSDDPAEPTAIFAAVQAAGAEAKRQGGDAVVCFDADVGDRVDRRRLLAEALRRPDAADHLSVLYQPVVELATGRIIGAEALARWSAPTTGAVPPLEFIALAEEIGEIRALSEKIVRTALGDLAERFRPVAPDLRLSINLSPVHLSSPDAVAAIDALIDRSGVRRDGVCFEMTENAVAASGVIVGQLAELRALGLDVAVDDFGTGHSSFSRLRTLPFSCIKVDQSFVAGIEGDPVAQSLVAAQVAIARALDLHVLAEGIEREEERAAVLELGIGLGQGFGLHRPMSADQLTDLLREAP